MLNLPPNQPKPHALQERVASLRKLRGLSQVALARKIGVSQQSYHHMEKNIDHISLYYLEKIAAGLEVPPFYLTFYSLPVNNATIEFVCGLEKNWKLLQKNFEQYTMKHLHIVEGVKQLNDKSITDYQLLLHKFERGEMG